MPSIFDALDGVIADVVAPAAAGVDRGGAFPRASLDTLAALEAGREDAPLRVLQVMAPTRDALLDFVGRATLGLPLLDEAVA